MNTESSARVRGRSRKQAAAARPRPDAIARIVAEQTELQQMFTAFENTRSVINKRFLVQRICTRLAVHAQVEEEIFYPAVGAVMPVETEPHSAMKAMVAHIRSLEPVSEQVDGPIEVLARKMRQHVSVWREHLMPQVKGSAIDLIALGDRMAQRRAELIASDR